MEKNTDNEIMLLVKVGDLEKLALLFERYKQALFSYFYRKTNHIHTSEDLVQDVFLRILKYRHRFEGYGKFTTWMYRIARNVYLDHCKKHNSDSYEGSINDDTLSDPATIESHYLYEESRQILGSALNKLNSTDREVLILSKYQKLSYKEIGKIIRCSEGTVKIRVYRALIELRKQYKALDTS